MKVQEIADITAKFILRDHDAILLSYQKIQTPNSLVFRLEYAFDATTKVLFVKMPAEGKGSRQTKIIQRLKREFQLAEQVKSRFDLTTELETVSPAGFIEAINAFVTWEVRGNSLQDLINDRLLFRYGWEDPELSRLSDLAGEWLHRFHSLDINDAHIDLRQDISDYCECRINALVESKNSKISKALAKSLMQNISGWIDEALSNPKVKVVLCHNDFSPHNIIVTDKGICVLDFSFSTPGLPAFDLACFWHKLEDLKWSLLRGNKGLDAVQKHFLNAYGSDFDWARPDVKLGLTRLILSKMLTLLDSPPTRVHHWVENQRRYSLYLSLLKSGFELQN